MSYVKDYLLILRAVYFGLRKVFFLKDMIGNMCRLFPAPDISRI